jgi:hypothetical protein
MLFLFRSCCGFSSRDYTALPGEPEIRALILVVEEIGQMNCDGRLL